MARLASFKMEAEEDFDATRWLDRALIRLAQVRVVAPMCPCDEAGRGGASASFFIAPPPASFLPHSLGWVLLPWGSVEPFRRAPASSIGGYVAICH